MPSFSFSNTAFYLTGSYIWFSKSSYFSFKHTGLQKATARIWPCISAHTWNKVKIVYSGAKYLCNSETKLHVFWVEFIYMLENKLITFTLNIQKLCIITIPGTGHTFWHSLFKMHQWISRLVKSDVKPSVVYSKRT